MKITQEILIEIANKSLANAEELINDATLLESHERIPRAYTLYHLAIEETSKAFSCLFMIIEETFNDSKITQEFLSDFKSHTTKTKNSTTIDYLVAMVMFKGELNKALHFFKETEKEKENISRLNDYKNYSLYTSIITGNIKQPCEIINKEDLEWIKFRAQSRFHAANAYIKKGISNIGEFQRYFRENNLGNMDVDIVFASYLKMIQSE